MKARTPAVSGAGVGHGRARRPSGQHLLETVGEQQRLPVVGSFPAGGARHQPAQRAQPLEPRVARRGLPRQRVVTNLPTDRLEARGRPRIGAQAGHQRRAAQRPGATHQPLGVGAVVRTGQRVEIGQVLVRLEREELGAARSRTHARAALSSCFISRTAVPIPVKSARLTMLCPMLSSSIASIRATGCTLA